MKFLECNNITHAYGYRPILRGVDFEVLKGDTLLLVGENGSGKTTLLKIISSLLHPTSGEISWFGNRSGKDKNEIRKKLGVLFSETYFYPELTVFENLLLYANLYQIKQKEIEISKLLERFQIEKLRESRVSTLSRGERQKTSLVRSILHDPLLVLWDEPFVGLDAGSKEAVENYIQEKRGGVSFVIASHEKEFKTNWNDRTLKLKEGKLS